MPTLEQPNPAQLSRIACYYRNSLHSAFREIRHIGPPSDAEAKCRLGGELLAIATKCQQNRPHLKSTVPYRSTRSDDPIDIALPYQILTGLSLEQLPPIFRNPNWSLGYGGEPWAVIAETTIKLKQQIYEKDSQAALQTCDHLRNLEHNSRNLVPTATEWNANLWIREKWPELCDAKK